MKKLFEKPVAELVSFEAEDTIMDIEDPDNPSGSGDADIW